MFLVGIVEHCGRAPEGQGRVGRALHGAGAEGGPRSASTVWERHGVTRRPTSLENAIVFLSINSCRLDCQFFSLYFPEIAVAGLPELQAARADLRSRPAAIFRSSTKR